MKFSTITTFIPTKTLGKMWTGNEKIQKRPKFRVLLGKLSNP